jgi:hypothetical protein
LVFYLPNMTFWYEGFPFLLYYYKFIANSLNDIIILKDAFIF